MVRRPYSPHGHQFPHKSSPVLAAKGGSFLLRDGRFYTLDGEKMWTTNCGVADLFTVFAKIVDLQIGT